MVVSHHMALGSKPESSVRSAVLVTSEPSHPTSSLLLRLSALGVPVRGSVLGTQELMTSLLVFPVPSIASSFLFVLSSLHPSALLFIA